MEKWPEMNEGDAISKEEIAEVISENVNSCRFSTVVNAWRKKLDREYNVVTKGRNGKIIVLDPHQRTDFTGRMMYSGIKRVARAGDVASRTDRSRLTDAGARSNDHQVRVTAMLKESYNREARRLREEKARLGES